MIIDPKDDGNRIKFKDFIFDPLALIDKVTALEAKIDLLWDKVKEIEK